MRVTLLSFAFVLFVTNAFAASPKEYYSVLGVGISSCAYWTSVHADAANPEGSTMSVFTSSNQDSWLQGYITAYNHYVSSDGNVSGNSDFKGLEAWMTSYCQQNPLDNISTAADKLIIELRSRKTR
jgi:hypothetical protein